MTGDLPMIADIKSPEAIVPNRSQSVAKLAEALSKAQGEITHAQKDTKNEFFKSKYATLAAVWGACRAALSKNGLAVVQTLESESGVVLVTTLMHSSGEWISGRLPVNPVKNDPQGLGSAITYMRRYALSAMVGVAPDDDDDGEAAQGRKKPDVPRVDSPFKNSSLRNTFTKNVIGSFLSAQTAEDLDELMLLNKAKLDEMKESDNEHDALALDELRKTYMIRLNKLKQKEPEEENWEGEEVDPLTEQFNAHTR